MPSKWAIEIAESMQIPAAEITYSFGIVESVKPLVVRTRDISISQNLYINPAYLVSDRPTIIEIFDRELMIPVHVEVFSFLKEFHSQFVLVAGDLVSVAQMGKSFYILEKVVRV